MRQLLHALIVATVAAVALVAGVPAETSAESQAESRLQAGTDSAGRSETIEQRSGLYARVVKPFGAPIRVVPSPEGAILSSTRCGEVWPVLDVVRGWVKIRTQTGVGWIGGARVMVGSTPPMVDCSGARFIIPTGYVVAHVSTGCSSLRNRPSAESPILSCVGNGHMYAVLDGPFDPGTGDDWFRVSSPSTGSGWALAEHLYPS
jgi:hypothetical protein